MNEISSSQSCGEAFGNIMAGSLRGDEVHGLQCKLWLFKSGSWDILASLFSSFIGWRRFEFCPMQGVVLGQRISIIVNFWFSSGNNGERVLSCSIRQYYVLNSDNTDELTERHFIDLLSACLTHRSNIFN